MAFFLALDQGTTSSRAIVFATNGQPVSVAQVALQQHFPQPGWVEHDPLEIWQGQLDCARRAIAAAGLQAADIRAIGITNQRETTILWERATGKPLHAALVWQDRRTADWCALQRERGLGERVSELTGLVLDPYFSASKIAWLLQQIPGARQRAERGELACGTVDSWLLWQLTGGRVLATDPSNAARTLLFDLHRGCWSEELLAHFDIPRALLAEVRPSAGDFGQTDAALFGVPIPICGIAGDQQAALFGQGCTTPGSVKNTYGTGCFMLLHTGSQAPRSQHGLLTTVAAQTGSGLEFALEGSVFSAGSAVQWLRDGLGIIEQASDIEALAASVPDSGGVVLVPAFTGLGSPWWDAHARGTIVGITRGTSRAHLARATLEAIALQSAELLTGMREDSGLPVNAMRADGGASANGLLMQLQADLLGMPVIVAAVPETTALGAARLAALGAGASPLKDADGRGERVYEPRASRDWADSRLSEWRRAVERSRAWVQD